LKIATEFSQKDKTPKVFKTFGVKFQMLIIKYFLRIIVFVDDV
jgi:hypothetical protein